MARDDRHHPMGSSSRLCLPHAIITRDHRHHPMGSSPPSRRIITIIPRDRRDDPDGSSWSSRIASNLRLQLRRCHSTDVAAREFQRSERIRVARRLHLSEGSLHDLPRRPNGTTRTATAALQPAFDPVNGPAAYFEMVGPLWLEEGIANRRGHRGARSRARSGRRK